jgi:hypothetical protein
MREVSVESVDGWVQTLSGHQMRVPGTRFSAVANLGQPVVYETRGRGHLTNLVGKSVVRAQVFLQNHLNHEIFDDQQLPVDREL